MKPVLIVTGPTASGKTDLAIRLAKQFHGELISADSRQVYKFLDIGTAKDKRFPHHMIDVADPRLHTMTVADYQRRVYNIIDELHARNTLPIIVGGTGLYIDAVLKGYQFPSAKPPPYRFLVLGIDVDRKELYRRIDERLDQRIEQGLIDEVKKLRDMGLSDERLDSFGLEYRYILRYLQGQYTRDQAIKKLKSAIHIFARHQYNWFKRWPVQWIKTERQAAELVRSFG